MLHGVDANENKDKQPESEVRMLIEHLPKGVFVAVADDHAREFSMIDDQTAEANWRFQKNTDGGVLSGFGLIDSWTVQLTSEFVEGIDAWSYLEANDSEHRLGLEKSAWLIAYGSVDSCRPDCTKPTCGDGILDGGEICDDGNPDDGDGCSFNCSSLE